MATFVWPERKKRDEKESTLDKVLAPDLVDLNAKSLAMHEAFGAHWASQPQPVFRFEQRPDCLTICGKGEVVEHNKITGQYVRAPQQDSIWFNPYTIKNGTDRTQALCKYEEHIRALVTAFPQKYDLWELNGKVLGCWCAVRSGKQAVADAIASNPPKETCHGHILQRLFIERFVLFRRVCEEPVKRASRAAMSWGEVKMVSLVSGGSATQGMNQAEDKTNKQAEDMRKMPPPSARPVRDRALSKKTHKLSSESSASPATKAWRAMKDPALSAWKHSLSSGKRIHKRKVVIDLVHQ